MDSLAFCSSAAMVDEERMKQVNLHFFSNQKKFLHLSFQEAILKDALLFKQFGFGNCGSRAAYAALELADIFSENPVFANMRVKSYNQGDHYVMMIGNKSDGWMVFDPLTNPEIVFSIEEYEAEVLQLFQKKVTAEHKHIVDARPACDFLVDADVLQEARKREQGYVENLLTSINSLSLPFADKKLEKLYLKTLGTLKIVDPGFKITADAIKEIQKMAEELNIPNSHPSFS